MDGMALVKTARTAHASLASRDVDDVDCLENLPSFHVRSANYALSAIADATLRDAAPCVNCQPEGIS